MEKNTIFEQFYKIARKDFKSDAKLAEALGMTKSSFYYYIKKENPRSPTLKTLEKWCDILKINYSKNIFKKK